MQIPHRVLIVEPDPSEAQCLSRAFRSEGFITTLAETGMKALFHLRNRFDFLVVSLELPECSGLEIVKHVKGTWATPALLTSSSQSPEDRIRSLENGADDFLVKPLVLGEVVARAKAHLRRSANQTFGSSLPRSVFMLDPDRRQLLVDREAVALTPMEYEVLSTLASQPQRTFSRAELLEMVWGGGNPNTRKVDLCISRIRQKMQSLGKPCPVLSVWGVGYRFSERVSRHSQPPASSFRPLEIL